MDGSASVVEKRDSYAAAVSPETVSDGGSPISDALESDLSSVADNDSGGKSGAVTADQALLSCAISCLGREVIVKTVDGNSYAGIFSGCKPTEFKVGLEYAYKHPGTGEEKFVLCRETAQRKIAFDLKDVVCVVAAVEEEKRGFATDNDYHGNKKDLSVDDFEEWQADPDITEDEFRSEEKPNGTGGWSVDDMFKANTDLGVQSSFVEDLSQYTTVEPVGNEADRERARRIADEIEGNVASRHRVHLENDDEERDLDKETAFDADGEFQAVEQRRRGPNSKYSAPRASGPPMVNGRSSYSRRDDTNSGGGPPYNRAFASRGNVGGYTGPGHRYSNRPQGDRGTGANAEQIVPRPGVPRYGGPDGANKPNTYNNESGPRYNNNNRYPGNATGTSAAQDNEEHGAAAGGRTGTLGKRTGDLKQWSRKFNNEYQPRGAADGGSGHTTPREVSQPSQAQPSQAQPSQVQPSQPQSQSHPPPQQPQQPQQQQHHPPAAMTTSSNAPPAGARSQTQNAWNRGPPTFEPQDAPSHPPKPQYPSASHRGPQPQSYEPTQPQNATWVRKKESPRRDSDRSSTSRKSSPTALAANKGNANESKADASPPAPHQQQYQQSEPSKPIVTSVQAPPPLQKQQPVESKQEPAAPSASPPPTSTAITSASDSAQMTSSSGRRFEFNPEAPAFVPKKDLTARCPSSTSTLSQTPVPVMGGVAVSVVPSMPPPTMVPQQPYVFNYQPQVQGVYAMPGMPVYGYPQSPQVMTRPQFPAQQHPAPPSGPSTSHQQVTSQQPSNAPTPSNSGQMGESPSANVVYHQPQQGQGQMPHSMPMQQQMQMQHQQQPPQVQQMPPPRPQYGMAGMAAAMPIPMQYQPMQPMQYQPQFAPAAYYQAAGQVTTMQNAMPPPNSMQQVGAQMPSGGMPGQAYPVFHQNPQQQMAGAPIVTSSQPYAGGPQGYAGNAGIPQMNYVVPNMQNPAAVRYVAPQQQQDYGHGQQYRP